jgi:hypothetical protein
MEKHVLATLFSVFFSMISLAQIDFESGYFIREPDEKVQCLIRNVDWKNNPQRIQI